MADSASMPSFNNVCKKFIESSTRSVGKPLANNIDFRTCTFVVPLVSSSS